MVTDESELIRCLEIISGVGEISAVAGALGKATGSGGGSVARTLIVAFRQEFSSRKGSESRWVDSTDGSVFDQRSVDWDALRAAALHDRADQFVRARVGHLIWDFRPGRDSVSIADAAIEAFVQLSNDAHSKVSDRVLFAGEAGWLARRLKRTEYLDQVRDTFLQLADASAESHDDGLRPDILEKAIDGFLECGGEHSEARTRLEQAIEVHAEHAYVRSELVERLLRLLPMAERAPVAEVEVDRLLQEAGREPALRREHRAREALTLARRFGLAKAQGRAAAVISDIKPEHYSFQTFEVSVPMPAADLAKINSFRDVLASREPRHSWAVWSVAVPTMQPLFDRPAPVMGAMESLVTTTLVSEQGHVTSSITDADGRTMMKHYEQDRDHYEHLYQYCIGPGLRILLNRPDAREALTALLEESPIFTDVGKRRIARAFAAFDDANWDVVLDTIPTIEAGIRNLALKAGVSPYSASGEANQFKTLGGLISDVTDHLEAPRIGRFWALVLTDALGYNLRNDYLHGIKESPTQMEATAVLQVFMQLLYIDTDERGSGG